MLATQRLTIGPSARAIFGAGCLRELPVALTHLSGRKALVVSDQGLVAAGVAGEVVRILESAAVETAVFGGVQANPDVETLARGARAARGFRPGAVVALGGGSVLDAAKGIALMATNDGPARDFDYRNEPPSPGLPVVAVPTTAGTGSETNGFAVIDDPAQRRKFYVGHESVIPRAVILDPELTVSLPSPATAASGMDVLAHALESVSSVRGNPYAEGICLQVTETVFRFLPEAVRDGGNLEARAQMLLAAHLAGLAFSTTGLGMAHAAAHALSARTGAVHGATLAVLLPHVLSFNLPARSDIYARLAARVSGRSHPRAAVAAVDNLARDVEMPGTLRELGATEEMVPDLVEDALADDVIANTPRPPSAEELRELFRAAL